MLPKNVDSDESSNSNRLFCRRFFSSVSFSKIFAPWAKCSTRLGDRSTVAFSYDFGGWSLGSSLVDLKAPRWTVTLNGKLADAVSITAAENLLQIVGTCGPVTVSSQAGDCNSMMLTWRPRIIPSAEFVSFDFLQRIFRASFSQELIPGVVSRLLVYSSVAPKGAEATVQIENEAVSAIGGAELWPILCPYVALEIRGPLSVKLRHWQNKTAVHVGKTFGFARHAGITMTFADSKIGWGGVIEI